MENKLIVSLSPHVHGGDSVQKNMYGVLIALIPAFLVYQPEFCAFAGHDWRLLSMEKLSQKANKKKSFRYVKESQS